MTPTRLWRVQIIRTDKDRHTFGSHRIFDQSLPARQQYERLITDAPKSDLRILVELSHQDCWPDSDGRLKTTPAWETDLEHYDERERYKAAKKPELQEVKEVVGVDA